MLDRSIVQISLVLKEIAINSSEAEIEKHETFWF